MTEEKNGNEYDLIKDLLDHCEEENSCCSVCDDCIMINDECRFVTYFAASDIENLAFVVSYGGEYKINYYDRTILENGIRIKIKLDGNKKFDEYYLFIGERNIFS